MAKKALPKPDAKTDEANPRISDPFGDGLGPTMDDLKNEATAAPPEASRGLQVTATGRIVTAQKVANPRDEGKIVQKMKVLCAINGQRYYYSWMVKDRQNNREVEISGPSIKMANDLARTYGNCWLGITEVVDTGTHWLFKAEFVDIETGYTYSRPFAQNKGKNVGSGMRDDTRREDMVFQIGASKAIRNCVVNALSAYIDYCMEESRKSALAWISQEGNVQKANAFIDRALDEFGVSLARVEAVIGRKRADWTLKDTLRVTVEMRGIQEGLTNADEVYPTEQDAKTVMQRKTADKADNKPQAATVDQPKETAPTKTPGEPAAASAKPAAPKQPEAPKPAAKPAVPEQGGMFGDAE